MPCALLDRDQAFTVHDFGPSGYIGTVNVPLAQGFQPGALISAVVLTNHEIYLNIFDASRINVLLQFGGRVAKDQLIFNSKLGDNWGAEETVAVSPLIKGKRASISIVYEEAGYRIFVNGKEQIFYKHRTPIRPDNVDVTIGQIFKIVYHTTMGIVP